MGISIDGHTTVDITHIETPEEEQHHLFIRAVLLMTLIVVSFNVNMFLKKAQFHYLGESAVTILLGLLAAVIWTAIAYDTENAAIQLSSKFFYMALLPPIIFEGGYGLKRMTFFKNIFTIISLAFFGALYSTVVISVLMYFFSKVATPDAPWSFVESLVFGSLISSTDPVTVLSLLPPTVDKRLYMIIFGESALNDAVAIILFKFFTSIADPKMRLSAGSFMFSVAASAYVFIGSFVVGVVMALIFAKITKHIHLHEDEVTTYESVMLLLFAYTSYLLADILGLTGIISVFFCGIAMAQYGYPNLSETSAKSMKVMLRTISFICESFIFLYLGLGMMSFSGQTTYNFWMIFFACISILIARTHVFLVIGGQNYLQRSKPEECIPLKQQVLIWFSGLRGAVAFALGVSFLEHPVFDPHVKGVIFGTTVMVVVLTVLVLGGLTPYMLEWLHITDGANHHGAHFDPAVASGDIINHDITKTDDHGEEYKQLENQDADEENPTQADLNPQEVYGYLHTLDSKYFRPFFTKEKQKSLDNELPRISQTRLSISGRPNLGAEKRNSIENGFDEVGVEALKSSVLEKDIGPA